MTKINRFEMAGIDFRELVSAICRLKALKVKGTSGRKKAFPEPKWTLRRTTGSGFGYRVSLWSGSTGFSAGRGLKDIREVSARAIHCLSALSAAFDKGNTQKRDVWLSKEQNDILSKAAKEIWGIEVKGSLGGFSRRDELISQLGKMDEKEILKGWANQGLPKAA